MKTRKDIKILLILAAVLMALFFMALFLIEPIFFMFMHLDPSVYEGLGDYYAEKGRLDKAISYYEKSLRSIHISHLHHYVILEKIARLFELKKDFLNAYIYWKKYVDKLYSYHLPFHPEKENFLKLVYYELERGKTYQALEWLKVLWDSYPLEREEIVSGLIKAPPLKAVPQTILLHLLINKGYHDIARKELERRGDSLGSEELYLLSAYYKEAGNSEKADMSLKKACSAKPVSLFPLLYANALTTDLEIINLAKNRLREDYIKIAEIIPEDKKYFWLAGRGENFILRKKLTIEKEGEYYLIIEAKSTRVFDIYSILAIKILNNEKKKEIPDYIAYINSEDKRTFFTPVRLSAGENTFVFSIFNDLSLKGKGDRNIGFHKCTLLKKEGKR